MPDMLHKFVCSELREQFPDAKENGFWEELRKLAQRDRFCCISPTIFTVNRFQFLPDLWMTEKQKHYSATTIVAMEIENANRISEKKLIRYTELWTILDDTDLDLRLRVFDRYGREYPEINLAKLYYYAFTDNSEKEKHNEPRSDDAN